MDSAVMAEVGHSIGLVDTDQRPNLQMQPTHRLTFGGAQLIWGR